ncbi:MAG: UDP-3-O-(3-hydroxymyristoyl)glucosamine N-acyltransferase [Bacteroidia bacterium]|nr:UDP-3-O-(3-hydroxymyristoyl)glucosamine N-acyltransferase [Bacteroidia bacterium]
MEFSAKQIAGFLGGEIDGNPDVTVNNLSKIEEGTPGTLSFLSNPKYNPYLYSTNASLVIINKSMVLEKPVKETCTLIKVDDAYTSFAKLMSMFQGKQEVKVGIEQPSFIHEKASYGENLYLGAFAYICENVKIGKNVKIHPNVYVGKGCTIGDDTVLMPGVKVYHDCVIGNRCTIHSNTVIGADGFGFAPGADHYTKIPQIGNVILEDDVDIGSCTCIDRATMGSTIIRKGAKLDNLIQIAHNVEIGEHTVVAGQTGIAGSTKVGKNCMFGAQVGIAGHLKIADGTKVGGQSGINGTVKTENALLQGSPAISLSEFQRSSVIFKNLPKLADKVHQIEKKLNEKN